jgi:nicotinate-nucleotide--dimethylbenzimidazole phosphoribosyltransferase
VVDGVIADAALLVAAQLAPDVVDYAVPGHRSTEPAARAALEFLGLEPVLDLDLRLGEGTGGLLAVPVIQAAAKLLAGMATFDAAGVAGSGASTGADVTHGRAGDPDAPSLPPVT